MQLPENKDFVFTIFDDPDNQTLEHKDVYTFLTDIGMRTTKGIWPLSADDAEIQTRWGSSCQNTAYLNHALQLQNEGFEIALHNVACVSSLREKVIRGLEEFHSLFGHYPYSMANHSGCRDSLYWGDARIAGMRKIIYRLLTLNKNHRKFQGHMNMSPYFWGDYCYEKITYVRSFVFSSINLASVCRKIPYKDPLRTSIPYWFPSSEGANVNSFNKMISEANQDRLAEERGVCIMYTHFAGGFMENGKLHAQFKKRMTRLSKMNGWFVPVHELLDHLLAQQPVSIITPKEQRKMEWVWLLDKILRTRGTS
ncbi:MAG: hypothetical protein COU90_03395 [Candidatus Ryanbacteria bacterium CG10_big_fil_rev_8_21_14_0_10_43_42]|uniref:NodB homology domain-containing protein n=1 Tax=Candidatus Ryanbacteria bacterium CG10_big_fil_rev_8_21_14_0_10_43_42 TaxID=1974864 RepID=A0A2M8KX50_9BACT|nr:MAG: hypothetical protein COU90_03395 [Candidatus Ryanbacteria bacterium CG10_big_fil_rev_8_21_14_0_10_43_42]